jgi:hypothetical protein
MYDATASNRVVSAAYSTVNTSISNNPSIIFNSYYIGGYMPQLHFNYTDVGFAISNTINNLGERYIYLVEGNNRLNSNYHGVVKRNIIKNGGSGIGSSFTTIFESTNTNQDVEYTPFEVELSMDGNMLAWGGNLNRSEIYIAHLNTSSPSIDIYNAGSNMGHGLEFSPDLTKLFFTSYSMNVKYIDLSTGSISDIPNSSAAWQRQIELANDGFIYVGTSANECKSINVNSLVFGEKTIPNRVDFLPGGHLYTFLPDQIDGYDYDYAKRQVACCVEGQLFTSNLNFGSITSTWTPAINPFQNGQSNVSTSAGFIISTGTKVTIQNMTIEFGPEAKVIVEPGATLILDNTVLTSVSCPGLWPGVEVWGDRNHSQNLWGSNGLNQYQGRIVVKNSSQINNAEVAIQAIKENADGSLDWSKTGGIMELYGNSKFTNNKKTVWIGGYKNYLPSHIGDPIYIRPNRSYIKDCSFFTDDLFNGGVNFHSFIALYDGSLVRIKDNHFDDNSSVFMGNKGTGIIAINAPIQVTNNNGFHNLKYGIKIISFDPSEYYAIDNNDFSLCYNGIYTDHTWGVKITSNYFNISPNIANMSNEPYGIYLNGDCAYHVEDNTFGADPSDGVHGIIANYHGAADNELYRNHFSYINYGIQPQLQNKGTINGMHVGLKLFCNDFANPSNSFDVLVLGKSMFDQVGFVDVGIADAQKISSIVGGQLKENPAGNIFSVSHQSGSYDFDNDQGEYLIYSYENNTALRYKPEYSANIGFDNSQQWPSNRCPSKLGSGGDVPTETALLAQAQTALNSSIVIRNIWKDGGQTNLDHQVETTQPWDVYVEFNNLIAKSPYLSDEVLMATIDNPAFTSLMIKLIMVANPQAAHNDAIMEAIYNRVPALPQSYIDAIEAGESSISQLELLEANVSANYHLVRSIENRIISIYRRDTVNTSAYTSMLSYLTARPGLADKYQLAATYLAHKDYINMQNVLSDIPGNFSLSPQENAAYQNYLTTFAIAREIKQNNKHMGDLSQSQISSLQSIISQAGADHSMALALLLWNNPDYELNELILHKPSNNARKAVNKEKLNRPEVSSAFKVFPNPAKDYFTLQYSNEMDNMQKLSIIITDMQGRIIRQMEFDNNADILVDTKDIQSGVYTVALYTDKLLLDKKTLTIVK